VLTPSVFKALLSRFPTGVTVVTARDAAGADHGITVNAFCALSLSPPLVLICIDQAAAMHGVISSTPAFAVNILAADQEALSRRFAEPDEGRFDGLDVVRALTGSALLSGTAAQLECTVRERHPAGDHLIVIGEVVSGAVSDADAQPLAYHRGAYTRLSP
jgi:flavin reductase (DIM6/NTAB) family NADH-FMN oxidoreductase RutF